jgi:hypothetical protein
VKSQPVVWCAKIPYSVVASALGVPEDDVESWVVLAISEGLLEARMDQFTNILDIRYELRDQQRLELGGFLRAALYCGL